MLSLLILARLLDYPDEALWQARGELEAALPQCREMTAVQQGRWRRLSPITGRPRWQPVKAITLRSLITPAAAPCICASTSWPSPKTAGRRWSIS